MAHSTRKDPLSSDTSHIAAEVEGSDAIAVRIAEKYEKGYSVRYLYTRQSERIIGLIKEQGAVKVLDVGCGVGNFLTNAQDAFPFVAGVDPGPESLAVARRLAPRARHFLGLGEHLPFGSDTFDAVVMKGVVHHLKEPVPVFREVARCLKPGGVLVIHEGNASSLYRRTVLGLADLMKVEHESTLFEHRAPEVMAKMVHEAGLLPMPVRNLSGFFVPLALTGFGGPGIWKVFDLLENLFQSVCPFLFNYHVLLPARKRS